MRIYIHMGMHKTGSTTVQKTMTGNPVELEAIGYRVFVNRPQMNAKSSERFSPVWLRDQVKIAEKEGLQAIVFSGEGISTLTSKQLEGFLESFHGYEVNLIVCFRHWVGFLPSRWAQNCSRRDTQSFPAYLNNLRRHENEHIDARFDLIIGRMIAANPHSIRLVSYDNATVLGTLLPTVLSALDLPPSFVDQHHDASTRYNNRRDIKLTELVRLFNGVFSRRNGLEYNELFKALCQAVPVGRFYDLNKRVNNFLRKNRDLKKQLLDMSNAKSTTILLSQNESNFARWQKMTEAASSGFIYNPQQSRLFCGVSDTEFACSEIEVDDIPVSVQDRMAAAFEEL